MDFEDVGQALTAVFGPEPGQDVLNVKSFDDF